jgi:hypothetical protein
MRPVTLCLMMLPVLLACPPPPRVEAARVAAGAVGFTVTTAPPGASVTLDGAPAGNTPVTLQLAPGTHTLKLTATGYFAVDGPVEVPAQGGTHHVPLVASH